MEPAPPSTRIRVAVIDDSEAARKMLTALLSQTPDMVCVGAYPGVIQALSCLLTEPADLVLIDLRMPDVDGIAGIPMLRRIHPEMQIVVLTRFQEESDIFQALSQGASGYLLKSEAPSAILEGIREVMGGGAPMSPAIAKRVVLAFQKPARAAGDPSLTERELAILTLLEVGRGYKGTATDLGISLNTVRSAVRKIYGKLQVHSLLEALERTRRHP